MVHGYYQAAGEAVAVYEGDCRHWVAGYGYKLVLFDKVCNSGLFGNVHTMPAILLCDTNRGLKVEILLLLLHLTLSQQI